MSWSEQLFSLVLGRHPQMVRKLPGPPPSLPLGNAGAFLGGVNPWEPVEAWLKQYGSMVLVWLPNPAILLSEPTLLREVFETRREDFYKDSPCDALLPIVSDTSPFIANGDAWQSRRRAHPFATEAMAPWLTAQVPRIVRSVSERLRGWQSATMPFELRGALERLTFDVFAAMLVGEGVLGDTAYADFRAVCDEAQHRLASVIPKLPPLSPSFYAARSRWGERFVPVVEAARDGAHDAPRDDDDLVRRFAGQTAMTPGDFAQEVANVFPAGVYSVTSTLTSVIWQLARRPQAWGEVRDALEPLGPAPSFEALWECTPLRWAVLEAMRLYPGAPLYTRNTAKDREIELGGVTLPKNTPIFVTAMSVHRDPSRWGDDADRFVPQRWASLEEDRPMGDAIYFPFGIGPRECLGKHFGLTYIMAAAATIVSGSAWTIEDREHRQGWYFAVGVHEGLYGRVEGLGRSNPPH